MPTPLTTVFTSRVGGRTVALELASESLLRLRVSAGPELAPKVSYAVSFDSWMEVEARVEQCDGGAIVRTAALTIEVAAHPFRLRVLDRHGNVRFETADDALRLGESGGVTLVRRMGAGERVYGLGECGESLDRTGRVHTLWNKDDPAHHPLQNFYCQIPFAIALTPDATPPHACFLDNPGRTTLDLGRVEPGHAAITSETGDFELWLLFEDGIRELVSAWADLTGRIERPPLWALGYHQCRWSYNTASEFRELAAEFRRRSIPCDALYFDIDYMDGYRVFTWHPESFPEPAALLSDLRTQGFHAVTIVDPGVKIDPEYDVFRKLSEKPGMFLEDPATGAPYTGEVWPGAVHYPDFTHPECRAVWGRFQQETLLELGVDGIWNDMDEPSNFITDTKTVPLGLLHHDHGHRRSHGEIHQVYGHTMAQASCEGFHAARPNGRPFVITRSGWAGVQRHAMVWTGDNVSTWASMPFDIQLNLSMGLTGIPFVGCDIGGFGADATPELFARWMEWGVFQPFCRAHSAMGTLRHEPWAFGPDVERVARRMIGLRMQLLPYIYTAFVEASESGAPVNRPMVYEFPGDATLHAVADQFLLGGDLLVAPVLEPGRQHRMVYLPAGTWYGFWNDEKFEGGRPLLMEGPLGRPPLFVRAGAVIPMGPLRQHVGDGPTNVLYLDVYPGARIAGALVEDDGETQAWRNGDESRTRFSGFENNLELKLILSAPDGDFRPPTRDWVVRLHQPSRIVRAVEVDGQAVAFERQGTRVEWRMPDTHAARECRVVYAE